MTNDALGCCKSFIIVLKRLYKAALTCYVLIIDNIKVFYDYFYTEGTMMFSYSYCIVKQARYLQNNDTVKYNHVWCGYYCL